MLSVAFWSHQDEIKDQQQKGIWEIKEYEKLRNMKKVTFPSKQKPKAITRQLRKHWDEWGAMPGMLKRNWQGT